MASSLADHHHLIKREVIDSHSVMQDDVDDDESRDPFEEVSTTVGSSLYDHHRSSRNLYSIPSISISNMISSHAVKRDVNLSTSACLDEVVLNKRNLNVGSNANTINVINAGQQHHSYRHRNPSSGQPMNGRSRHRSSSSNHHISSLERYCESPSTFLLDSRHTVNDLICGSDDDTSNHTSNGGRSGSRLSENADDMLFSTSVLVDVSSQHQSMLRDVVVVTPTIDSSSVTNMSESVSDTCVHPSNTVLITPSDVSDLVGDFNENGNSIVTTTTETTRDESNIRCGNILRNQLLNRHELDEENVYTLKEPPLNHFKSSQSFVSNVDEAEVLSTVVPTSQNIDPINPITTASITLACNSTVSSSSLVQPIQIANSSPITSTIAHSTTSLQGSSESTPITTVKTSTLYNGCHIGTLTSPQQQQQQQLDIKILPAGLIQLASNLAAVFPSSSMQSKQIAIQLLRDDGTSIILPITTIPRSTVANTTPTSTTYTAAQNSSVTLTSSSDTTLILGSSPVTDSSQHPQQIRVQTSPAVAKNSTKVLKNSGQESTSGVTQSNDSERPFKCELCNSTFTRLGNYTRHKKIHSLPTKEDQRFRCDICGKSFIQRCDLARHLHIHRGTEPHRCPQCGKGYIRHSDLVTHQRFHNKEKPFACPHCSKGFCQRGDLNRHLRSIHLQLKPILCTHCHKKFAKEETLLRHINSSHRDKLLDSNN